MLKNKKLLIVISSFVLLFMIILGFVFTSIDKSDNSNIDNFAKCLNDKNVVMYGAYWCPHCKKQKQLFGKSFEYINYVECTIETKKCEEEEIKGYPTWIFEDGTRISGQMSFEQLSNKSSCPAP